MRPIRNKRQHYRLPDGHATTNVELYARAWKKLAAPIERALDVVLTGFDPSMAFRAFGGKGLQSSIQLELWVALRLYKALTGEDYTP